MIRRPRPADALSLALLLGLLAAAGVFAHRRPDATPTPHQREAPWFADVARQVRIDMQHENGATGQFQMAENLAPGVALFDADNDGDLDVLVVQSGPLAAEPTASRGPLARLFRNDLRHDGGRARLIFTDVSETAGLRAGGYGMGVAIGDIDGDGLDEVYLTALGHNVLYRNLGGLRFEDITATANANDERWSTSAAFADIDGDNDLDLFVANYVAYTPAVNRLCYEAAGARDYCAPTTYRPVPDRLLRNRGDGTFEDVTEAAGLGRAVGNGLGVAIRDFDDDGHPDIYVANDATPNQLWRNLGDGRFEDLGPLSGAAFNALGRPEGSMGIAAADIDHDGDIDLAVTNIVGESFVLYRNDGAGGFEDDRVATGLAQATAAMTGFGAAWLDGDNDGVLDLLVANGAVNVLSALRGSANPYRQLNQLFRGMFGPGRGGGPSRPGIPSFRLEEVMGPAAGAAFALLEVSRGLAIGDLDNDGWPDAVLTNNAGAVRVLGNTARPAHAWLGLALRQAGANPSAIGALVTVASGPATGRRMRVGTDGSFLSASDPRQLIGLGMFEGGVNVTVTWPDGTPQRVSDLQPGRYHVIRKPATEADP